MKNELFDKQQAEKVGKKAFSRRFIDLFSKNTELQRLLTPDFFRETKNWTWKEDLLHVNRAIGLSISSAFYGVHLPNAKAIYENAQLLSNNFNIADITATSGFSELFQVGSSLSEKQMLLTEMIAAKKLITQSLDGLDKKASDVDLFIVATSAPSDPELETRIAQAAGISKKTPKFLYVRACDSSGSALFAVQSGVYDHLIKKQLQSGKPATITIYAFEDGNRLSNKGGDPYSAQLFSTAGSAMTFAYHPTAEHTTFKLIAGEHASIADGAGALKVGKTYKDWPEKNNAVFADHLIEPENGQVIQMDPRLTPRVFKQHVVELVTRVLETHAKKTGMKPNVLAATVKKVIMHHPSKTISDHVMAALGGRKSTVRASSGLGFPAKIFEWVITEGNAPSAIIPIAMGRQMDTLRPRDIIMTLSYGAGGSFTCAFYKLGRGFR